MKHSLIRLTLAAWIATLAACTVPTPQTTIQQQSSQLSTASSTEKRKLKVFGAYATAVEEPWVGVIHSALLKAKDAGEIEYTYTDEIGYTSDMERVLREVAEKTSQTSSLVMPSVTKRQHAESPRTTLRSLLSLVLGAGQRSRTSLSSTTGFTSRHTLAAC